MSRGQVSKRRDCDPEVGHGVILDGWGGREREFKITLDFLLLLMSSTL